MATKHNRSKPINTTSGQSVAGHIVQHDASGQGHCWCTIHRDDIPVQIRLEIGGEIIDGRRDSGQIVASNGLHYRWLA